MGFALKCFTGFTYKKHHPNCRNIVQKKICNFLNFINLILATNYNFQRVYNPEVCFILLLTYHSLLQNLDYEHAHPVQVCTGCVTINFTKIDCINFKEN